MGNLSFHTQHKDGKYTDHAGSSFVADTHTEVTVHHATGSFASGDFDEHATSQYGMDAIIYKISKEGVPQMVFAADSLPADADDNPNAFEPLSSDQLGANGYNGSVNGRSGGQAEFFDIDSFADQNDVVAVGGSFRGKLTFPSLTDDIVLVNTKAADRDTKYTAPHFNNAALNGFVAKVDMNTGKALWATDAGLTVAEGNRYYTRDIATTKAGHVIHSFDERVGSVYKGQLTKYAGADGTKVWEAEYESVYSMNSIDGDSTEEVVYVTGILKGTDIDPFRTGTNLTATKGDAVVAALDVSGGDGPAAKWVLHVGRGSGYTVEEQGEYLIVAGNLNKAETTIGTCSLTGSLGGFLIKLNKADGTCVWAKDTPTGRGAVTDGTSVWTFGTESGRVQFGTDTDVWASDEESAEHCDGRCYDIVVGKYDASNGNGLWAAAIGGTGADSFDGAVMTADGPVLIGVSTSETIQFGGLTLNHLQHASPDIDEATWGPNRRGPRAIFSMLISPTDVLPSCISSCPTGEVSATDTTIVSGQCYVHNECLANGAPSKPFPCFQCDAANQKALSGQAAKEPLAGYCYFDDECKPAGEMRSEYKSRNEPSVCEWCAPTVDANDWSLKSGFFHDRTFAQEVENGQPGRSYGRRLQAGEAGQANDFDMLFEKESNGCRIMPDMAMPASPSADLTAALGGAASGAVADVAALASGAIAAVRSATPTNQHAEIAWVHYFGNSATCTKSGDVCQHTPSALADMMGQDFVTHLHYGDSVARVKVQEGLSMLIAALADSTSEDSHIANLKKDVVAHMLIPYYQGAIKSAHHMDAGADTTAKATAQTEGKVYWTVINDAIGGSGGFVTADRAYLTSMFASAASGNFNYCAASTRLHNSLPPAYQLQYVNYVREGTMVAMDSPSNESVLKDVGLLQGAIDPKECTMPPPPSPSAPPPPIASPAPPSGPTVSPTSNSLSEGELAGIAVGAVIGAILLLLILGLVLRAFLFKEVKPIFTCLEAKEAKPDLRAVAAPVATPVEVNNA